MPSDSTRKPRSRKGAADRPKKPEVMNSFAG
jgi:hypothetical protein